MGMVLAMCVFFWQRGFKVGKNCGDNLKCDSLIWAGLTQKVEKKRAGD